MSNVISLIEKLEKGGKPAQIGETRIFSGKQYQKMGNGEWRPVKHEEEKQLEQMDAKKEKTPKQVLQEKLTAKTSVSVAEQHLSDLKNGAVLQNRETRSGKPVFTNLDAALANAYTPEDFREAGNMFYDRAEKLQGILERMKDAGQKIEPAFLEIQKININLGKQFLSQANRIEDRRAKAELDAKTPKPVKKSEVHMGYSDGATIDTAAFALERTTAAASGLLEYIQNCMSTYQYGDIPKEMPLDKGCLYLVKVEEGLYSGLFKESTPVENGELLDNAKIRIERMTIPSIVELCIAKEWHNPRPQMPSQPEIQQLTQSPEAPVNSAPVVIESTMDKKIRLLELIDKLLN